MDALLRDGDRGDMYVVNQRGTGEHQAEEEARKAGLLE